ncbi:GIY-YIG nuclease family protein [Cohnella fermenti]|uniref:GIY-YIG nuclease family protein n=1 Tax=Cohnella fermenti TaxID=2565925 RepID=A0A4S4BNB6_9BACL|nr:GIY-YIG nuclease family protein [Cohnella fermenti]THF76351.1 GIY-YIG nuclease family protein [Cohnella fermenti]
MQTNRRKELQEEYKQIKTYMGVVRLTNRVSGKMFIDAYPNLKNKWMTLQMQLDMGRFANAELQKDWNELGKDAFEYEVLEQKDTTDVADVRWETKMMGKRWLEKLQPYGDSGYNRPRAEP